MPARALAGRGHPPYRAGMRVGARVLGLVLGVAVCLGAGGAAAQPAPAEPEPDRRAAHLAARQRYFRLAAVGAGILLFTVSETAAKGGLAADTCRWCGVNGFDASARDALLWGSTNRARRLSDATGYVMLPLGMPALLALASAGETDARWTRVLDDIIPVLEAATYGQLLTQVVKFSAARQRPFVHYATTPLPPDHDYNMSFFSGHSSYAFSIAFAAGAVASRRGYALAPLIWTSGVALAASTAYLRVAADRHYASDVIVGSAVGAAAGLLIPRLTGSLPDRVRVVPRGDGVSLVGTF